MTESPKKLAREATTGESSRTYPLAAAGVSVIVGAIVVVILVAALLVYYLA